MVLYTLLAELNRLLADVKDRDQEPLEENDPESYREGYHEGYKEALSYVIEYVEDELL